MNIFGLKISTEYEYEYIRFENTNTNTNIFVSKIKTKYEYKYIRLKNKNRIRIRMYSVWKYQPNTNTNIFENKDIRIYSNIFEYIRRRHWRLWRQQLRGGGIGECVHCKTTEILSSHSPLPLTGLMLHYHLYIGFDAVRLYFQVSWKANIIRILS